MTNNDLLIALAQLHEAIDAEANAQAAVLAQPLRCAPGCSACCIDDITVFTIEADNIRVCYSNLLMYGSPHNEGSCAFLDDNVRCRVYAHRPYVCRTQGLPLRWIDKTGDVEYVEMRDICPLNEHLLLEKLPGKECWTLGPWEGLLAKLQKDAHGNQQRVLLRSLFTKA